MAFFRQTSQPEKPDRSIFSEEIMYEPLISNEGHPTISFSSPSNPSGLVGRCQRKRRLLALVFVFGGFSLIYLISLHSDVLQAHLALSMDDNLLPSNSPSSQSSSSFIDRLPPEFRQLLNPNRSGSRWPPLFLLEPQLLSKIAKKQLSDYDAEEFRWRFSLPPAFQYRTNSLTVGIFAEDVPPSTQKVDLSFLNFTEQQRITGSYGPFNQTTSSSGSKKEQEFLHHAFYQKISDPLSTLHLHLVVLFPIRQLLWIGAIDEDILFKLNDGDEENPARTTIVHYGKTEEVFDPFKATALKISSKKLSQTSSLVPDDIPHLLSQLATSKYLHCNPTKTTTWFQKYDQKENAGKVEASRRAISRMKSLMRRMKMQFWAVCGTLLGWYRQCFITPYTTDTDFASFSKYIRADQVNRNGDKNTSTFTEILKAEAAHHQLYLMNRFGERWHSLEYSFATTGDHWEKVDLFFIYPNRTHYLMPFHIPPQFAYSIYPRYSLCSGELLGFKIQIPCTPEEVILAEYGQDWEKPVSSWSYYQAPKNIGPLLPFSFNVTQQESYSP